MKRALLPVYRPLLALSDRGRVCRMEPAKQRDSLDSSIHCMGLRFATLELEDKAKWFFVQGRAQAFCCSAELQVWVCLVLPRQRARAFGCEVQPVSVYPGDRIVVTGRVINV